MGGGSSKEASPKVVEPVNVVITKEVAERWHVLLRNQEEAKKLETDGEKINGVRKLKQEEGEGHRSEVDIVEQGREEMPKLDEDLSSTSYVYGNKESATSSSESPSPSNISETYEEYNKMDGFANFFVHKDTDKLRDDLENGKDIENTDIDTETRYSFFLNQPSPPGSSPKYEEINETGVGLGGGVKAGGERKHRETLTFIDEEALIGDTDDHGPNKIWPLKDIRVSKYSLPVVVDQDENGDVTVESVNAWKMRERMEKEISKHNARWREELRRISAKIEDETKTRAEKMQWRLGEVQKQNPELALPLQVGGEKCNKLTSKIQKCYEKNQNQILKCNDLVREFAQCTSDSIGKDYIVHSSPSGYP